jgi:transcriptional regulator with XRE-family HTH domain
MALFFDTAWFDAKITARNLTRGDVARALGIGDESLADIWKDQRELSASDVAALAALLGVSVGEVAERAGVSTPVPQSNAREAADQLAEIAERLTRLERMVADVKALLIDLRGRT